MQAEPSIEHHYQNLIFDSGRWSHFTPRDGDVVVCTSYKAGTTWTQMMCALLIHQSPRLARPLAELSPWLDMRLSPIDEVIANFESQTSRRVIKTHTPLDGFPYYPNVSYVYCARDPRDVFMSMQNHLANVDMQRASALITAQGIKVEPPPPLPEDVNVRFKMWMTMGTFAWEQDGLPYWSNFHHAETFWAHRDLPNIHFMHFTDLKANLDDDMRRLADFLRIEVDENDWPALVKAATFEEMKANADRTAPDTHHGIWRSNARFFNTGANDQWGDALSEANQQLYQQLTRERYDHEMLDWLERGSAAHRATLSA
jgi:aryl sulfotransferase